MTLSLSEKPPSPVLGEQLQPTIPLTEVGQLTLRAYYGGMLDDIDPQAAREIFAFAAQYEQTHATQEDVSELAAITPRLRLAGVQLV